MKIKYVLLPWSKHYQSRTALALVCDSRKQAEAAANYLDTILCCSARIADRVALIYNQLVDYAWKPNQTEEQRAYGSVVIGHAKWLLGELYERQWCRRYELGYDERGGALCLACVEDGERWLSAVLSASGSNR